MRKNCFQQTYTHQIQQCLQDLEAVSVTSLHAAIEVTQDTIAVLQTFFYQNPKYLV